MVTTAATTTHSPTNTLKFCWSIFFVRPKLALHLLAKPLQDSTDEAQEFTACASGLAMRLGCTSSDTDIPFFFFGPPIDLCSIFSLFQFYC
jgi:hypothetical protein